MKKLISTIIMMTLLVTACAPKTNQAYLQAVRTGVSNYQLQMDLLDTHMTELKNDPKLIEDGEWQSTILEIMNSLQKIGTSYKNLPKPSPDEIELNNLLLSVADEIDLMAAAMTTAVNALDASGITSAGNQRETIKQHMDDVQSKLNEFPETK